MEKYHRRKVYLGQQSTDETNALLPQSKDDFLQLDNLHPKKREDQSPASRYPKDQTIECDIQPSDTLHSISLKYNIPLAELKRVNNILSENEFYALKRIKIPVKPSSFLKDLIPGVHYENGVSENGWYVDHKTTPNSASSALSSGVSTGYSSPCSELDISVAQECRDKKKVRKFLKDIDKDMERIKEKQSSLDVVDEQDCSAIEELGGGREEVIYSNFVQQDDGGWSNGSLLWWCFLLVLLVFAILAILMALMTVDHHPVDSSTPPMPSKHQLAGEAASIGSAT